MNLNLHSIALLSHQRNLIKISGTLQGQLGKKCGNADMWIQCLKKTLYIILMGDMDMAHGNSKQATQFSICTSFHSNPTKQWLPTAIKQKALYV